MHACVCHVYGVCVGEAGGWAGVAWGVCVWAGGWVGGVGGEGVVCV